MSVHVDVTEGTRVGPYKIQFATEPGFLDGWDTYREVGAWSAATYFIERLPAHMLPARIIDRSGAIVATRAVQS